MTAHHDEAAASARIDAAHTMLAGMISAAAGRCGVAATVGASVSVAFRLAQLAGITENEIRVLVDLSLKDAFGSRARDRLN